MKKDHHVTISHLARTADVNVETVRYYERRGLVNQPIKPAQGYRRYPQSTLLRLVFIKRAQSLGFTLDEIAQLLALGDGRCCEVQDLATQKLASVQSKIADLQRMEKVLDDLVAQCQANSDESNCPVIETLIPDPTDLTS